jgi:prepilin-type N-terminal cleavage/methylation domain-containing protein
MGERDHRTSPRHAFTLVEFLCAVAILLVLGSILAGATTRLIHSSSLATSAANIRQLAAGAAAYLGENNQTFWKYRENLPGQGVRWWFGFETLASLGMAEGKRQVDPYNGPLGAYVPAGFRPDPSFAIGGKAFKPKYQFGYIGVGYNVLLADSEFRSPRAWIGTGSPARLGQLSDPSRVVVFATSAQINAFQPPASSANPMLEEFYGLDEREVTVHFRNAGRAMVAYATGNAGFLEIEESTRDRRAPDANVGRFAPVGSTEHLR